VSGSSAMVDAMRSTASGFIFTTSMPPSLAAGAAASIRHLKNSGVERSIVHARSAQFKRMLVDAGFPLMNSISHIVPLLVGDAVKCKAATDLLLRKYSIYVQPINYPTVPKGSERLRMTPSPFHSTEMMRNMVEALQGVWRELNLPLVPEEQRKHLPSYDYSGPFTPSVHLELGEEDIARLVADLGLIELQRRQALGAFLAQEPSPLA
jgi:5-aminolevulinate synthase